MSRFTAIKNKVPRDAPGVVTPVWERYVVPLLLILLGLFVLQYDLALARSLHEQRPPRFLLEIVENTEPFGHAIGVIVILATLTACRPGWTREYFHAGLISLGAGLCTDLIKVSYGRIRPRDLDWSQVSSVNETFQGWFPVLWGLPAGTSIPSGHTTVAFAFAVCLGVLYPSGRWMLLALACMTACGRVLTSAHYPSDVCLGAAVGWSVAHLAIYVIGRNALTARITPRSSAGPAEPELSPGHPRVA